MLNVYLPFGLEFWETALGVKPPKDKFEIVRHTTKDVKIPNRSAKL